MIRKVGIAVLLLSVLVVGPAAAQYNTTPVDYYNDTSTTVDNASWIEGRTNATAENYAHWMSRIGPVIIGGDGDGAGVVLTGLLFAGFLGAMAALAGVGFVAGATLAVIAAGALVIAGFAPMWLYAIAMFAVGAIGAALVKRALK